MHLYPSFNLSRFIFLTSQVLPLAALFFWGKTGAGKNSELFWIDLLYNLRGETSLSKDILILAIDEPSFQSIAKQWPWPRSLHAHVTRNLTQAGARSIAWDILFAESSNQLNDTEFARAIKASNRTILGASIAQVVRRQYTQEILVQPLPLFSRSASGLGLLNFLPDREGTVRRFKPFQNNFPSLGWATLFAAEKNLAVPDNLTKEFFIDYAGPAGSIPAISYYQALEMDKYLPEDFFQDKFVFIGLYSETAPETSQNQVDKYPTPFFSQSRKNMPGVELHANTALTILNGFPIKTCQAGLVLPIYALICIIPALFRKSPLFLTLVVFGLILSLILASILLFLHHGKILKIAAPGFAIFLTWFWCWLSGYALTLREKIKIKQAFSKYIPPILIREILKNPKMLNPGGEKRNLTVLFSDIREITSISEQLSPEDLVLFLNQFHTQATELIFKHKGLLDKYIGDAVMAVYGAPVPIEDHPYQACKTALAMKTDLDQDNLAAWQDKGLPKPDFGIGINTGWMILGNMGSKKLFDYTVIGDAVNLASRLEGLNKFYQTKIIISESTYAHVKKKFPLQGVGPSQGQRKGSANQDLRAPGRL